jgi:hypothetical protein
MTIPALSGMMQIQIPAVSTILILSLLLNSAALVELLNLKRRLFLLLSQPQPQNLKLKSQLAKHSQVLMKKAAVTAPVKVELNHHQNVGITLTGLRMVSPVLLASQL